MLNVIYEDKDKIIVNKPAGQLSQSARGFDMDLVSEVLTYRKNKGEEAYAAIINRLDRPVSGLVLIAKNKKEAARLSALMQRESLCKQYLVLVCGRPHSDTGTFTDYLLKNGKTNKTEVVKAGTPDAKKAELDYELIDCIETKVGILTWVLVIVHTGRHHQIRAQFASRGLGLYGDTKYNPAFQKTKKKYTEIDIEVFQGTYDDVVYWIKNGVVDLGFITIKKKKNITIEPLYRDELLCVLPSGTKENKSTNYIDIEEMKHHQFVTQRDSTDADIQNFLKENSLQVQSNYHVVDDLSTIALVEKGFGICLMPKLVMTDIPYKVDSYPTKPPASRIIGLAAMNPNFMAPAVRTMFNHIVDKYQENEFKK